MSTDYETYLKQVGEYGIAQQVHYPIVTVSGIPHARPSEIVIFETGEKGYVFTLSRHTAEILLLSRNSVKVGTKLARTDTVLSVPVGDSLLGTLIDSLGTPLRGSAEKKISDYREVDTQIPPISNRVRITAQFHTGVTAVDTMIPIGHGQRELIIGDRKTGKTSFLLNLIKNQKDKDTIIIYAAIGKKNSDIKKLEHFFESEDLLKRSVIVATNSLESPSLIYLTPYTAQNIAEYFRDQGRNTIVIFDDLSTHAKFYRELSLIAGRYPGRDSYPGDIFSIHAQLLERAGNFRHKDGAVSITCFPVVEVVEGDLSGYIQTNLMGMTDGHIYFDTNIYYRGQRPAINIALSVTRVGRQTQSSLKREINHEFSSFLSQFEKMQNYAHFGAELSSKVKNILKRGQKINALFNQHYSVVVPESIQLVLIGMVWLDLFNDYDNEIIVQSVKNLSEEYQDPKTRQLIDSIVIGDSLGTLLTNISKQQEVLLHLCKIINTSPKN